MWIAGVMQGLMWRAVNADGTLTYTFVESVKALIRSMCLRGWWTAVPQRHAHHALERPEDGDGRPSDHGQHPAAVAAHA
jgi:hypothetical protein